MRSPPRVVVIGGGLAGMAAAYALGRAGLREIQIVERERELGGLAGSFCEQGRYYPLGYHHILSRDRRLREFLELCGIWNRVSWRRVPMLFQLEGELYDLGRFDGLRKFPLPILDKLRLGRLLLRSWSKADWDDWDGFSAEQLLDAWAGPRVRQRLFEPLTGLKFGRDCAEVSAAWLGTRLHYREGAAALGYVPGHNWTTLLCRRLTEILEQQGCRIRPGSEVVRLQASEGRIAQAELRGGERIRGDVFISTVPTEAYLKLTDDGTEELHEIRYTALLSVVAAATEPPPVDFYWLNLSDRESTACAVFRFDSLNPAIGHPGQTCLNFVTHLGDRSSTLFATPTDELLDRYREDYRKLFGARLELSWSRISRIGMYSPVFRTDYRNPPLRSSSWANVFFAGTYRTHPSIASTGSALGSGMETAHAVLQQLGLGGPGQQGRRRGPRQE